jgi:hypothetical protein
MPFRHSRPFDLCYPGRFGFDYFDKASKPMLDRYYYLKEH